MFSGAANTFVCQLCCGIWLLKALPLRFLLQGVRDLFVDYSFYYFFTYFFYPNVIFFSPLFCDTSFYLKFFQIPLFLSFQIIAVMGKPFSSLLPFYSCWRVSSMIIYPGRK